ncbi:MAG: endolytic transglycosylase MltG [Actinomycetota bacterium]|nr:endolytic transglycosylase MltG [Actinomycetota bacterium]
MTYVDDRGWRHDPWDDTDHTDATVVEHTPGEYRKVRWAVWVMAYVGLAGIVIAGLVGLWYTEQVNPKGAPGDPITFTVNADDDVVSVSERMHEQGLISDAGVFQWYVDHHGGLELTPGYYLLRPDDHMGNVMRVLRTPPSETFTKVTFPEGYSYEKMGLRLQEKVPRLSSVDFNVAATDGLLRSRFQPEGVNSLEGLLFPDTYQVSNGESEAQVIVRMIKLMERVGDQENLETGAQALGLTPYQVLIVASLIEREAKVPEDRPKIARVIYNRLYLSMPLQIDATLYYRQDGERPFGELKALDTPYNTYLYQGLPPTPIASPGRASIEAALHPASNPSQGDPLCMGLPDPSACNYLYYVLADEDGGHVFAVTLEQHEANVQIARDKGLLE